MNTTKLTTIALGAAGLALMGSLQGCATAAEKRVDAQLASEPPIRDTKGLDARVQGALKKAAWITDGQRQRIAAIRKEAQERLDANDPEERQLRAILMKDLVAADYDPNAITVVAGRIKSLQEKSADELRYELESERRVIGRENEEPHFFGGTDYYTGSTGSPGLISISL